MEKKIEKFIEENRHFIEQAGSLNEWEVIEVSDVKDYLTSQKNEIERQLFEAFLSGYDLGYDSGLNKQENRNIPESVEYVQRNFNEDFEL